MQRAIGNELGNIYTHSIGSCTERGEQKTDEERGHLA
jgi:hypothetical protein